jgi:hypothetical protein
MDASEFPQQKTQKAQILRCTKISHARIESRNAGM